MTPEARRDGLAAGILTAAVLCCFHSFSLTGVFHVADDSQAILYPAVASAFERLKRGDVPQWWPQILLGYPGAGSVELHLFSPLHWPFLFFRPGLAIALRFVSCHLLSALTMYALGRHLRLDRRGAVVAGLVWALAPPAIFMLIEPMASATVPWFPLVLLCWDRACHAPRARGFLATGLVLGLTLLGGHLQHVLWFGLFLGGWAAVLVVPDLPREQRAGRVGRLAAGAALVLAVALGVAAIEVLPSIELFRDSIRAGLTAEERLPREQPAWLGAGWLLAASMFTVEKPQLSLEYARIGPVPLALALFAVGRSRRFENRVLALACGFLALALGDVFPPSNWLIKALPGNSFRFAERIGLLFSLSIAILAGRGASLLLVAQPRPGKRLAALAALALFGAVAARLAPQAPPREEVFAGLLGVALLALSALTPVGRGRGLLLTSSLTVMLAWSAWLLDTTTHQPDALAAGAAAPRTAEGPFPPAWLDELPSWDEHGPTRLLCVDCPRGNTPLLTGQQVPTGYVTLRPSRVDRLVYGRQHVSESDADAAPRLARRQNLLDLLGVRYVVASSAERFTPAQLEHSLVPVRRAGGLVIFENRTRLPRAFFVSDAVPAADPEEAWALLQDSAFQPRRGVVVEVARGARGGTAAAFRPARVIRYEAELVDVWLEAPGPGWLVLLDRWAEGWSCQVNGRPTPVLRADYLFRAVQVEAGPSLLRFEYHASRLVEGTWISGLTLASSAGALLWRRRRAPVGRLR